jgi:hypothetical protein
VDATLVRLRPSGGSQTSAASILGLAQQQIGPVTPMISGAATITGDSVAAAQLLMGAKVIPPWSDRAPVDVGAVVALYGIAAGDRGQSRTLYLRQHLLAERGGFWIGGAIGQIDRAASFASNAIDAGAWIGRGRSRITAMLSTTSTTDHEVFRESALTPDQFAQKVRVGDGSLTFEFATNRIDIESTVGGRVALEGLQGSGGFVTMSIGWRVARLARIVVGAASQLADPLRGTPEWRYVSIGMRFANSPSVSAIPRGRAAPALQARRVSDSTVRFMIAAPADAHTVEIAGTFTAWEPVALFHGDSGWEITLPATPGAHHLQVRINRGEWRVPVNLTPGRDEFNTRFGIIVLP